MPQEELKPTYKLGGLCKRKHEYKNTGKSLRDASGHCVICHRKTYNNRDLYKTKKRDKEKDTKVQRYLKQISKEFSQYNLPDLPTILKP